MTTDDAPYRLRLRALALARELGTSERPAGFPAGQTVIVDVRDGEIFFEGAGVPPDVPP